MEPFKESDDIPDPPGQQSLYIPPGDVSREAYRLSTFEHFPVTCPISGKSLAKSGFFFTGFYDRVKCFACARTVERWEETDNPTELKWHKQNCPFPKGEECGNISLPNLFQSIAPVVPIAGSPSSAAQSANQTTLVNVGLGATLQQPRGQWRMGNVISADHKRFLTNLYLNRELDRVASFARWPTARPNIAPAYLAKTGFFYLGDLDRTQCFSCGGVLRNWNLEDDAEAEHRTHFPQCRMVNNLELRNIPVHKNPETEEEKERKYPCRFPANPHMRSENQRLGTFDRRWPLGKTAAIPAEIAQAGFFSLGQRDRAKCWYCNGGLQNWEYDDIPWIEHAKWFPNCQFLLRVKGQHFVHRHLAANPYLSRPIIGRQDGSPLESVGGQPPAIPVTIDPQAEIRKRKERVQNIMRNSDLVKTALAIGFDDKIVSSLLEDRIVSGNETNPDDVYESLSQLLDDILKIEEIGNQGLASVLTPVPSLFGPTSTRTTSSMYSGISGASAASYYGSDDDEEMEQDIYGSTEGTSASVTNHSQKLYIRDAQGQRYLIDTGADLCFFPASSFERTISKTSLGLKLTGANGSAIDYYGKKNILLNLSGRTYPHENLSGRTYPHEFIIADVKVPIIGVNFLSHYGFDVSLRNSSLVDAHGFSIQGKRQSAHAEFVSSISCEFSVASLLFAPSLYSVNHLSL